MPHITRHGGPEDLEAAEELATQRRLEQEAQNLDSIREHRERRAEAVEQERTGTPASAEQDRLRAEASAAHAERRKQALAQSRGEDYEPEPQAPAEAPIGDDEDGPEAA